MASMMNAIMEAWIKPWSLHNINPIAKFKLSVNLGNLQLCKRFIYGVQFIIGALNINNNKSFLEAFLLSW